MKSIRVAIAGLGNCATPLIQGLEYYKNRDEDAFAGLMHHKIGDWDRRRVIARANICGGGLYV